MKNFLLNFIRLSSSKSSFTRVWVALILRETTARDFQANLVVPPDENRRRAKIYLQPAKLSRLRELFSLQRIPESPSDDAVLDDAGIVIWSNLNQLGNESCILAFCRGEQDDF